LVAAKKRELIESQKPAIDGHNFASCESLFE